MLPSLTSPLRPSSRPRCERSPFPVESPTLESIDGAIAYGHNLSRFLQHYACVYGESQSLRLVLCTYRTSCPGLKGIHRLTQHTGTPLLWCRHTFVLHVVCVSQTFMNACVIPHVRVLIFPSYVTVGRFAEAVGRCTGPPASLDVHCIGIDAQGD